MPLRIQPQYRPAPRSVLVPELQRGLPVLRVKGMYGLGDNIYQRAFVRSLVKSHNVYLDTSWPELYSDLPVRFIRANTALRTQAKNIHRQRSDVWTSVSPHKQPDIHIQYGSLALSKGSIIHEMERCTGVAPAGWDLPPFPRYPSAKPIAVVRPVTVRSEWTNSARNPLPEYVAHVAQELMRNYHVISVADLEPGKEWLIPPTPPAHEYLHQGELDMPHLLGLIQSAAVVVGGVGWIVPACVATGVPLFCILGGHGAHNAPEKITDRRMELRHVAFAYPDQFCRCADMRHACNKYNSDLREQWRLFRTSLSL